MGFRQRQSLEEPITATPVTFESLISWSGFEKAIVDLKKALELQRILKDVDPVSTCFHRFYNFLAESKYDKSKHLYEAWRILRKKYKDVLLDLSQILDVALEKYIINKRRPSVNLLRVLSDLTKKNHEMSKIMERIRTGRYAYSELT